jgi:hypothetical protein
MLSDTGEELLLNGFTTQVQFWTDTESLPWFIWELIPVKVEGLLTPSKIIIRNARFRSPPFI